MFLITAAKRGVTVTRDNVSRRLQCQLVTSSNTKKNKNVDLFWRNCPKQLLGLEVRSTNIGGGVNELGFSTSRLMETVSGSVATQNQTEQPNATLSNKMSIGRLSELTSYGRFPTPLKTLTDTILVGHPWRRFSSESLKYDLHDHPLTFPTTYSPLLLDTTNLTKRRVSNNVQATTSFHTSIGARRHFSSTTPPPPTKPSSLSQYKTSAKIPTPKSTPAMSSSPFALTDPKATFRNVMATTWNITKTIIMFLIKLPGNTLYYMRNNAARREKIQEIKDIARHEFDHYWTGTKVSRLLRRTHSEGCILKKRSFNLFD